MSRTPPGHRTARAVLGSVLAGAVTVVVLSAVRADLPRSAFDTAHAAVLLVYDGWAAEQGSGS